MLNEERVILMTRMASYEKGEGKKNVKIGNYFRSDYIAIQIIKSVIASTVAYAIVFALYILYNLDDLMQELYTMDLFAFARDAVVKYGIVVIGYGVLTYIACSWRHAKAKKSLKNYYYNLKKLSALYDEARQGSSSWRTE